MFDQLHDPARCVILPVSPFNHHQGVAQWRGSNQRHAESPPGPDGTTIVSTKRRSRVEASVDSAASDAAQREQRLASMATV